MIIHISAKQKYVIIQLEIWGSKGKYGDYGDSIDA
jgi:hypothetical protein